MKHTDVAKSDKSVESDDEGVTSDDLSDTGHSSKGEKHGGVTYSKTLGLFPQIQDSVKPHKYFLAM